MPVERRRRLLIVLLIFVLPRAALAQDGTSGLWLKALTNDILTSSYEELRILCVQENLAADGTRQDLQQRLFDYYGLVWEERVQSEGTKEIRIRKAQSADYLRIESGDSVVRISGKIIIEIYDPNNETRHIVKADQILFNQDRQLVTAVGNIEYTLEREDRREVFRGDELTFNTETWDGMFFKGLSETEEDISGEKIIFYYRGDEITRSTDDIVTLKEGSITSCDEIASHYTIRADRVWVISQGEWVIRDAVLYVGKVPLFYFPFYYHPSEDFFFNPSVGYDTRRGYSVQTTSYIGGKKAESDKSTLSFMQIGDRKEPEGEIKMEGFFLVPLEEGDEGTIPLGMKGNSYIKVIGDIYSRLGYLAAIESQISPLDFLSNFSFYLGLARSRYISPSTGSSFVPDPLEEGYDEFWHKSYFFGLEVPFRYALEVKGSLKQDWFSLDFAFPVYSDKSFKKDFLQRSENLDWGSMLGLSPASQGQASSGDITSTSMSLSAAMKPPLGGDIPSFLNKFEVQKILLAWYFSSKDIKTSEEFISFFCPEKIVFPQLNMLLGGIVFSGKESASGQTPAALKAVETALKPPFDSTAVSIEEGSGKVADPAGKLLIPGWMPDIPLTVKPAGKISGDSSYELTYTLYPNLLIEGYFNNAAISTPGTINTDILYSQVGISGRGVFNFTLSDYLMKLSMSSTIDGGFKRRDNLLGVTIPQWDQLVLSDRKATKLDYVNDLNINLDWGAVFGNAIGLTTGYHLNSYLIRYLFDTQQNTFTTRTFNFSDKEMIIRHSFQAALNVPLLEKNQQLRVSATIPPLTFDISPSLQVNLGGFTGALSGGVTKKDEEYVSKPLSLRLRYNFDAKSFLEDSITYDFEAAGFGTNITSLSLSFLDDKIRIADTFNYDFKTMLPVRNNLTLNVWDIAMELTAQQSNLFSFDPALGWVVQGEEKEFVPTWFKTSYSYSSDKVYLWKNRINLDGNLRTDINWNLLKYTDTQLLFTVLFTLHIHEFLDLSFQTVSGNRVLYLYIPQFAREVGKQPLDFFLDLLKSFDFFNETNRIESNFNLRNIKISLNHYLHDWMVSLEYSSSPELITDPDTGYKRYKMTSNFSFFVSWVPIPELKRRVTIKDDEIGFE